MFLVITVVLEAAGLFAGYLGYMEMPRDPAIAWSLFIAGFFAICFGALFGALGVIVSELRAMRRLLRPRV